MRNTARVRSTGIIKAVGRANHELSLADLMDIRNT